MPPRSTRDDTAVRRSLTTQNIPDDEAHASMKALAAELAAAPIPALTIVWHPRAHRAGERVLLYPLATGGEVQLSRNDLDFVPPGKSAGEPLDDPYVSRKPIVLRSSASGGVTLITPADGTRVACGSTVVNRQIDFDPEQLARGVPLVLAGRVVLLLHLVEPSVLPTADSMGMAGDSTGIRRVRNDVERVADLNIPVLIRGETGAGKELVARAIHEKSPRRTGPFVAVNLAAVPKDLATAELFGAAKGAFTGATRDREGYFQAARGGTLFLDELGEAPLDVQVMLLRVLETGEMYPVGASTPVPADVRLIAATDANLEAQIQEERFKAPLLHRVSGYKIWIPPLRQRREDIGVLVYHFAKEELAAIGESHRLDSADPYTEPWLPPALATLLVSYDWPGNIRQLRNVVRRIAIGSRGQATTALDPQLEAELSSHAPPQAPPHAPQAAQAHAAPQAAQAHAAPQAAQAHAAPAHAAPQAAPAHAAPQTAAPTGPRRKPSDVSEEELVATLRAKDWDLKAAADELGIQRPSIYDLIRRSPNIRKAGDLSFEEIERCFHECGGDLDRMVMKLEVSKRALQRRLGELGLKGQ